MAGKVREPGGEIQRGGLPAVVLGDSARRELCRGAEGLADILSRTYGPEGGRAVVDRDGRGPEVVTSAGILARRLIDGASRRENAGMMLMRHGVWRVQEEAGDGAATTAVLTRALISGGRRAMHRGIDAEALRSGVERALAASKRALQASSRPIDADRSYVASCLRTMIVDRELGAIVQQLYAEMGPEVGVDIEEYVGRCSSYRLTDGSRWLGRTVEPGTEQRRGGAAGPRVLSEPYVLVTNQAIRDSKDVRPVVERILAEEGGPLLVIADKVTGSALGAITQYCRSGAIEIVPWVPRERGSYADSLADIAALTGAKLLLSECGDRLAFAQVNDLGYAKRATIGEDFLQLQTGAGDPEVVAARVSAVESELQRGGDERRRDQLLRRRGALNGTMAVLQIASDSERDRGAGREEAERAVRAVPALVAEGVVAGGGASLLHCAAQLAKDEDGDTAGRLGVELLQDALLAPMRCLVRSTGRDPGPVVESVRKRGVGWGFDVSRREIVDMWEAGILDGAKTTRIALEVAVSTALTALSAEAVVLKRQPMVSIAP